jgi:hypothetical protein
MLRRCSKDNIRHALSTLPQKAWDHWHKKEHPLNHNKIEYTFKKMNDFFVKFLLERAYLRDSATKTFEPFEYVFMDEASISVSMA